MAPAIVTLVMGLALGYLAQRSRICFIGGLRDWLLVRDSELVKGAIAFFVTAWLLFSLAGFLGQADLQAPTLQDRLGGPATAASAASAAAARRYTAADLPVLATIGLGGLALGLFSTLANGCPTRQHILAAQGVQDSMWYLLGFYLGVPLFYLVSRPLVYLLIARLSP